MIDIDKVLFPYSTGEYGKEIKVLKSRKEQFINIIENGINKELPHKVVLTDVFKMVSETLENYDINKDIIASLYANLLINNFSPNMIKSILTLMDNKPKKKVKPTQWALCIYLDGGGYEPSTIDKSDVEKLIICLNKCKPNFMRFIYTSHYISSITYKINGLIGIFNIDNKPNITHPKKLDECMVKTYIGHRLIDIKRNFSLRYITKTKFTNPKYDDVIDVIKKEQKIV